MEGLSERAALLSLSVDRWPDLRRVGWREAVNHAKESADAVFAALFQDELSL